MNPASRFAFRRLVLFAVSILAAGVAGAATYLPLSDEELAARSPVIVRARVLGQETRIATVDGADTAVTVTRFRTLEVIKGDIASETFRVELPGGVAGEVATWVPGTPSFAAQSEVLLFLSPTTAGDDEFSLTEFGLSKFDVVEDRAHRRFAVRTTFRAEEDDFLALGENAPPPSAEGPRPLRDADSFAASLASEAAGLGFPPVVYAAPDGNVRCPRGAHPAWVNIGGTEGSGGLFRWFWDTGRSAAAIVSANGTQSGLTDGSNGFSAVANAVSQWSAVSGATVRYSQTAGSAPVVVNLDVESKSPYWTSSLSCTRRGDRGERARLHLARGKLQGRQRLLRDFQRSRLDEKGHGRLLLFPDLPHRGAPRARPHAWPGPPRPDGEHPQHDGGVGLGLGRDDVERASLAALGAAGRRYPGDPLVLRRRRAPKWQHP